MSLPGFVISQFSLVNHSTTDESEYFGPYNALLNSLFPASECYQIAPQSKHIAGSIDFTVTFPVSGEKVPALIMRVMTNVAYNTPSSRKAADDQMRESILDCSERLFIMPKLYGLSFFGSRYCVFEYTHSDTQGRASRSLTPRRIDSHPDIVTDTAPKERWNLDIWEGEGGSRLIEIVDHIKTMVDEVHMKWKLYDTRLPGFD